MKEDTKMENSKTRRMYQLFLDYYVINPLFLYEILNMEHPVPDLHQYLVPNRLSQDCF